ncbi:hypothetical protein FGIG_06192, partial [Fasciola gigantica]
GDLLIKYKDEDGDFITIADESDLSVSVAPDKVLSDKTVHLGKFTTARATLKFQLDNSVKGSSESTKLNGDKSESDQCLFEVGDRAALVQALRRLRDQITSLADSLDVYAVSNTISTGAATGVQQTQYPKSGPDVFINSKRIYSGFVSRILSVTTYFCSATN